MLGWGLEGRGGRGEGIWWGSWLGLLWLLGGEARIGSVRLCFDGGLRGSRAEHAQNERVKSTVEVSTSRSYILTYTTTLLPKPCLLSSLILLHCLRLLVVLRRLPPVFFRSSFCCSWAIVRSHKLFVLIWASLQLSIIVLTHKPS
ncbi:hypothetical protein VTI74DRAFT_5527 [Chaetomium olivicolor]